MMGLPCEYKSSISYFITEQKMYAFEKKFHEKSRLPIQQDESKNVHSLFTRSEKKVGGLYSRA